MQFRDFMLTALIAGLAAFGGAALAQRLVRFEPPAVAHQVELRPLRDGGVELTAYARSEADGGFAVDRSHTCDELTAVQRTAARAVLAAGLACWRAAEGM